MIMRMARRWSRCSIYPVLCVVLVVGYVAFQCTAQSLPSGEGSSENFEDLVDRLVASRWQALEKAMRAQVSQQVQHELQLEYIENKQTQQIRHDRRRLQQLSLKSLNSAIQQLRQRVSNLEVSVTSMMDKVDREIADRKNALDAMRKNVTTNIQLLETDLAALHDEIDFEVEQREMETNSLRTDLASNTQLAISLQGEVDNLCYPSNEVDDEEDDLCYLPTAKTFIESDTRSLVRPKDTIFVRPEVQQGRPLIAPITAYTWRGNEYEGINPDLYERPIYKHVERDSDDFWKYLVDELLLSRVPVAMVGSRGCDDPVEGDRGPGNMCPRVLRRFVTAVQQSPFAENVIRVGMFDPTGAYRDQAGGRLDLSNRTNWEFFWSYNIKIFFDTIPRNLWFLYQGKPLIASWTLRDSFFSKQRDNARLLLAWLKEMFLNRYGIEPLFVLQDTWFFEDPTITTEQALGKHEWFSPQHDDPTSIYSYANYNGRKWGVTTPGFRNGESLIGCGQSCREVTRRNGTTLINALEAGEEATLILLEGWTDMVEGAGFYRSDAWQYPSQYINIVRRFADPYPATLRFEAEGADRFVDTTPGNAGSQYALRDLDVGALPNNTGWYVGWVDVGEWIEFRRIRLGCGRYRFTARVATANTGKKIRLAVNSRTLSHVRLPMTGGLENYELVHLGEVRLKGGAYNLRIFFETAGGLNLDWMFVRRASKLCGRSSRSALVEG